MQLKLDKLPSRFAFNSNLRHYAMDVAREDGDHTVDGSHLERILAQLLLDFAT